MRKPAVWQFGGWGRRVVEACVGVPGGAGTERRVGWGGGAGEGGTEWRTLALDTTTDNCGGWHLKLCLRGRATSSGFGNQDAGQQVQGLGIRMQGYRFGVQDAGQQVQGSGIRATGSGSGRRATGSGFRMQGNRFRVRGSGRRAKGSGFRDQDAGLRVQAEPVALDLEFRVQGLGCHLHEAIVARHDDS